MKSKIAITISFVLIICFSGMTQLLENHRWEDRVLLLSTPDYKNDVFTDQINNLKKHKKGLKERKIVIYELSPDSIKIDGKVSTQKELIVYTYNKYDIDKQHFKAILIGLDGGEKHRSHEPIDINTLFAIIDKMPMRRAEIRKKR